MDSINFDDGTFQDDDNLLGHVPYSVDNTGIPIISVDYEHSEMIKRLDDNSIILNELLKKFPKSKEDVSDSDDLDNCLFQDVKFTYENELSRIVGMCFFIISCIIILGHIFLFY